MAYRRKYWSWLIRYTERGYPPIDNNRCENAICPFLVRRKALLFSNTPAGAYSSAVIYSLLQTAQANTVKPYQWLRHMMRKLPEALLAEAVEALLTCKVMLARQDSP